MYGRLIILLLFLSSAITYGQRGSIKGIVKDQKTGETLPGVNIYIPGTSFGTSSDLDGAFTLIGIPEGRHIIVASCLTYETDTARRVEVQAGKIRTLSFLLKEKASIIEGVEIVGKKRTDTDISMMSSIRQSNLVINGISAQQISRSLDKDAAEVVRRVPGITIMDDRFVVVRGLTERYNSVYINSSAAPSTESDQRAFSFDVVPSNMIDNILVYKTPAPELPADFAGATIRIFTKNTTDENHFGVSFQTSYVDGTTFKDFYSYKGGSTDLLGFDNGTRKLPASVPSTAEMFELQDFSEGTDPEVVLQRKQRLTRIARDFQKVSTANPGTAFLDNKVSVDFSFLKKVKNLKISNISSISYKYGQSSTSTYRATYESYDIIKDSSKYIYEYTDDAYSQNVQLGGIHNWSLTAGRSVFEFRNLVNQIGKSRMTYRDGHDYYRDGNRTKSYELAYMSRTIYSGQLSGSHKTANDRHELNWTLGYSYAFKDEPDIRRIYTYSKRVIDENGEVTYLPFRLDYASTVNTESNGRLFSTTLENIYNITVNYSSRLKIRNWEPELKMGIYAESKDRAFNLRTFGISRAVPQSAFNQAIFYQPLDSIYADTNFNFVNGIKLIEDTRPEYSYNASVQSVAGYVGLKLPIGSRMVLYGGGRVESFHRKLADWQDPNKEPEPDITADTIVVFPSANLTYNISNRSLFRVSYGTTVNRPEYREIAPYAFYDFELSATVYGNRELKDSYVKNLDFRYEFYPSLSEMFSLGLFYKEFTNPIELNLFPASNGWDFVSVNSVRADNYGMELEMRKSLNNWGGSSLLGRLVRDITVSVNAAYIQGTVEKDNDYVRDKKRALFGQSPYIINTGLFYQNETSRTSISLLYNLIGKRIVIVGTPTIPNVHELPRHLIDLVISQKIGNYFTLKIGAKDLMNSQVIYRQTFDVEIDGVNQERIQDIRRFTPGRNINLTITYSY